MKLNNIIYGLIALLLLNGCMQSTALIGPAITVASTGNLYQAGISYGTNELVKKETGQDTIEYISSIMEPVNKKKEINEDFIALVENQIKKTRKKIFLNKN